MKENNSEMSMNINTDQQQGGKEQGPLQIVLSEHDMEVLFPAGVPAAAMPEGRKVPAGSQTVKKDPVMIFISDKHREFYYEHEQITARGKDYRALVYTLGISPDCRKHFSTLYDAEYGGIIPDGLRAGWQTDGSRKITRLAFNLYTWHTAPDDDPELYAPKELFSGLDNQHRRGAFLALEYFT